MPVNQWPLDSGRVGNGSVSNPEYSPAPIEPCPPGVYGRLCYWEITSILGRAGYRQVSIMSDKGASVQEPEPLWDALGSGPDFGCLKS